MAGGWEGCDLVATIGEVVKRIREDSRTQPGTVHLYFAQHIM